MKVDQGDISLGLNAEQKDALRERENASPTADVFFRACPICAFMAWSSTRTDGSGRTIVTIDDHACHRCVGMRERHGELFDYVIFMMRGQRLLVQIIDRVVEQEQRRPRWRKLGRRRHDR